MRSRLLRAALAALASVSLGACHATPTNARHFHINTHPMAFTDIDGNLLAEAGYATTIMPDNSQPGGFRQISNPRGVHVEDEGPADADGIRHANVWIFPGNDPSEELRVHFVYGAQQYDDTFDRDVRVEVRKPYTVHINGMPVLVTEQLASTMILDAYAAMIRQVEAHADPALARAPVANVLRQLAPCNDMPPPAGALSEAAARPARSCSSGGTNPWSR